jgi:hypothetical protein
MKTLSPTFALILAGVALVTVLSCEQRLKSTSKPDFVLEIGDPNAKPPKYVELKKGDDDSDFCAALTTLKQNGGDCKADFKGSSAPSKHYDCTNVPLCLTTDKVTTSHLAKNAPVGKSAANDPNITYRVQGNSKDIKAILETFR